MKKTFILLGVLLILSAMATAVRAEIIVVGGSDINNTNPPIDQNTYIPPKPTIDFIECPSGYDCIREGDYNVFINSLAKLADKLEIKASFLSDILERFDKKIQFDESTIKSANQATLQAQKDAEAARAELATYKNENSAEMFGLRRDVTTLTVQVNEMKASDFWKTIAMFMAVIAVVYFSDKLRPRVMFIWDKFVDWMPFKM